MCLGDNVTYYKRNKAETFKRNTKQINPIRTARTLPIKASQSFQFCAEFFKSNFSHVPFIGLAYNYYLIPVIPNYKSFLTALHGAIPK